MIAAGGDERCRPVRNGADPCQALPSDPVENPAEVRRNGRGLLDGEPF